MSNEKKQLSITQPQEWIDALVKQYAPVSEDVDLAIQNMGLHIATLEQRLAEATKFIQDIADGGGFTGAAAKDFLENTHD